jgi:hypothetical protein
MFSFVAMVCTVFPSSVGGLISAPAVVVILGVAPDTRSTNLHPPRVPVDTVNTLAGYIRLLVFGFGKNPRNSAILA